MKRLAALGIAVIALTAVTGLAHGANKANTTVDCCHFTSGIIDTGDSETTYFLIGRVSSPKHSCEKYREFDVTFEKQSENIDKHKIGSGFADSHGIVAWAIPHSKQDFDPDAYYRVKATTTPHCKSAQGEKTSGF